MEGPGWECPDGMRGQGQPGEALATRADVSWVQDTVRSQAMPCRGALTAEAQVQDTLAGTGICSPGLRSCHRKAHASPGTPAQAERLATSQGPPPDLAGAGPTMLTPEQGDQRDCHPG